MLSFLMEGEIIKEAVNYAPFLGGLGVALCVLLCGLGSAIGLYMTGTAASAVLAEKPKKNVLLLAVLPATQGIYGFVLGLINYGKVASLTGTQGLQMLVACLPLAIVGMLSAIMQAKTSVGGLKALAKSDLTSGKLMLYPAMVETYAILALVVSMMMTGAVA